jgi:hypothetical protein
VKIRENVENRCSGRKEEKNGEKRRRIEELKRKEKN